LFGGSGQLGHELRKRADDLDFETISPVTTEVNITEADQVKFLVNSVKPNIVINCAAYTAVDKAEEEPDQAFAINRNGARNVAEACADADVRMIHISTDYVFAGDLGRPLRESDPTNPLSVYGHSKLAGEQEVIQVLPKRALVVRTSSLHGQKGVNFVHTMIKLFQERDVVRVVHDQTMSPTWAGWLAEALLDCARLDCSGIVHASCNGRISWFEFAEEILRHARVQWPDRTLARLEPITAAELHRPAQRPHFSAFDTSKLSNLLGRPPISWTQGLVSHLTDIGIGVP